MGRQTLTSNRHSLPAAKHRALLRKNTQAFPGPLACAALPSEHDTLLLDDRVLLASFLLHTADSASGATSPPRRCVADVRRVVSQLPAVVRLRAMASCFFLCISSRLLMQRPARVSARREHARLGVRAAGGCRTPAGRRCYCGCVRERARSGAPRGDVHRFRRPSPVPAVRALASPLAGLDSRCNVPSTDWPSSRPHSVRSVSFASRRTGRRGSASHRGGEVDSGSLLQARR